MNCFGFYFVKCIGLGLQLGFRLGLGLGVVLGPGLKFRILLVQDIVAGASVKQP